jgi:DMSO/TMAO reductase YedYZ molybdopterin-dependent catalytic subunit
VTSSVPRRQLLRLAALAGAGAFLTGCRRGLVLRDERDLATAALTDARAGTEWARRATATPGAHEATPQPAPVARALGIDTDVSLTANDDFYTMKYNPSPPPAVDAAAWRLEIAGLTASPVALSLADLTALPATTVMRTLECISNPAGGSLIGNAVWRGVALGDVLASVGPVAAGRYLRLESADGYHTGVPVELAVDPRSYLVFEMNGAPLPAAHGFPVRCLFPGRYGQKQPKWLTRITVQDQPHVGHWERQGWSDTAAIQVNGRIDGVTRPARPGDPVVARGIAFADTSGVARVDMVVDSRSEEPVTVLRRAPAPFSDLVWAEWSWTWSDPPSGAHVLQARARDGAGFAQRNQRRNLLFSTFPDGTSDMHQVSVQIGR